MNTVYKSFTLCTFEKLKFIKENEEDFYWLQQTSYHHHHHHHHFVHYLMHNKLILSVEKFEESSPDIEVGSDEKKTTTKIRWLQTATNENRENYWLFIPVTFGTKGQLCVVVLATEEIIKVTLVVKRNAMIMHFELLSLHV